MTTIAIRKKLTDYLKVADDDKVKAIYTMVADEINTAENDWDEDFVKELKSRSRSFANKSPTGIRPPKLLLITIKCRS